MRSPRFTRRLVPCAALLAITALLAPRGGAEECRFQTGNNWVRILLPSVWESENRINDWYSGYTKDRTVWLSTCIFESLTEAQLKEWLPRHLWDFGVNAQLDWTAFHSAKGRKGDWNVTDYFVTGNIEEGPCEVSICVFELDDKARFVVTTGGSPANRKKHRATIENILATIKRSSQPTEILK